MRRRTINKPLRVISDPNELPYVINAAEAGLLLRIYPERVSAMAKDGLLPGVKQGQKWLFKRDDIVAHINRMFPGEGPK